MGKYMILYNAEQECKINLRQLDWMENTLPDLLAALRNRDEVYEPVDDNRLRQWMKETNDDELEYWKRRIPEVRSKGDQRFTEREFVYSYNPEISVKEDDLVLDVGAGPLPKYGNILKGEAKIKYIPLDPLAYSYKKLLDDLNIKLPVYTKFAMMELLTCFYPTESADYVIVNNALDHSIDILRAFAECLDAVRVGGYLLLEHMEAEGAHNEYTGLHTWNITSIDHDLIFFDETHKVNISRMFSTCCEIDIKRMKQGYRDLIIAKISKKESVPWRIMQDFNVKEFAGKIINMAEYMRAETTFCREDSNFLASDHQTIEILNKITAKNHKIINLYERWMKWKNDNCGIFTFIQNNDFKKVAVYGLGSLGRSLCSELESQGIEIAYIIDQSADIKTENCKIYTMQDELPDADAIIITPIMLYEEIAEELAKKMRCPILSLDDIVP